MSFTERRIVLRKIGAAGVFLASGCMTEEGVGGTVRPEREPENVPEGYRCDDEQFAQHPTIYGENEVHWGDSENVSLRADGLSFEYGDSVNVTLTNTGSDTESTGNKHQYNVELYTESGWQEVRGTSGEPVGYSDEGVTHGPGEGFLWNIELTENGIVDASNHWEQLRICPPLTSGRYRFVYSGLIHGGALAVAFDLHRETGRSNATYGGVSTS